MVGMTVAMETDSSPLMAYVDTGNLSQHYRFHTTRQSDSKTEFHGAEAQRVLDGESSKSLKKFQRKSEDKKSAVNRAKREASSVGSFPFSVTLISPTHKTEFREMVRFWRMSKGVQKYAYPLRARKKKKEKNVLNAKRREFDRRPFIIMSNVFDENKNYFKKM